MAHHYDWIRRGARWGMAASASASLLGLMTAAHAQVQFHPVDKKPTGCPLAPVQSSPSDIKHTITVKDHAAVDVHVKWQTWGLMNQCGQLVSEGANGAPIVTGSGAKTLTAGQDWAVTYDTATTRVYISAWSDADKGYCWENKLLDPTADKGTVTFTGSLFGTSCTFN